MTAQRRFARVGDDDDGPYDKNFPGKKVIADGGKVSVRLALTDARPDWMQLPRRAVFDARSHQPRFAVVDASDAHVMAAAEARQAYIARLSDAWKTPSVAPTSGAPSAGESARDAYVRRISSAWKTPPGSVSAPDDDDPNPVEAPRRRWLSPGATPGSDAATATKDAAVADRDVSYNGYIDRLTTAWKRPYGPILGGRR
jgi:hypothetical protein